VLFHILQNIITLILVKPEYSSVTVLLLRAINEVLLVSLPPHISRGIHVVITAGKELEITLGWPPVA
jgi:hypothetical protein